MPEKPEIKVTRTYSLDPDVIAWVTRKSSLMTIEAGERISDSKVVNDILRAAMERDAEETEDSPTSIKRKTNPKIRAARAEAVAA